ncbi:MAG: FAD-dependent oxidoreductase [Nocardiopsaceae bacterium]|nr:FAD-dependent oxidoreductase [Nocardiopsaceae bacterium]
MSARTAGARWTPPAPKHTVYWRETEQVDPGPPLAGDVRCDVAIIGAGYTGMWTAFHLKKAEPGLDVQIVEADYAGSGASGHGDGFVTPTIGHSLESVAKAYGTERAKVAYSVVGRSIVELRRFCQAHGIDAQYETKPYLQVATTPAQRRWLERDLALIGRMGGSPPELLERDAVREIFDSPTVQAGFGVGGAMVNPHRLSRGLSRVLREMGVGLHERSPAMDVRRSRGGHTVVTPGGTLSAPKLLYATNAYQYRFAPLRTMVRPYWSYAAVTEPLTDAQLKQVHWPDRQAWVEARSLVVFGRLTAQNRLLIGGGPPVNFYGNDMSARRQDSAKATALLRRTLARYYPAWADLSFTHAYGGCIDMTPDMVPHVGSLGDGSFFAHGYCGNGVATTNTVGKSLRDLILEKESAYTDLLFVGDQRRRYPAEPLAFLGGRVRTAWMTAQDRWPGLLVRDPEGAQ